MTKRKGRKAELWAAVWSEVAFADGREQHGQLRTFTVASTRAEAIATMACGLMGLPGIEGSNTRPDQAWKVPAPEGAKRSYALWLLREGFVFIPPHTRMTHKDIGELIGRLVAR